jgi:hypothetical protein
VKRSHTLRNLLIIAGVMIVMCCAGAIAYEVVTAKRDLSVLRPAQDTTNKFVRDLELGDYPAAYGRLCARTRDEFTLDHFDQTVRTQPHIRAHRIVDARIMNVNLPSAIVIEELTQDSGSIDTHAFIVVKEDGAWKVCNRSWPY